MLKLEDIQAGGLLEGLVPGRPVTSPSRLPSSRYDTSTQRIVKENATQLGFYSHEFEH